MKNGWHALSIEEIFSLLTSSEQGLTSNESIKRLRHFGPNELELQKGPSFLFIFLRQFLNPLVFILIIACLIKFFFGNFLDASVLSATILIMVLIGFFQEAKAEKAMLALKELSSPKSKVKRNGNFEVISSAYIVPGDIILLETGDKIPADARLIHSSNLNVNESSLTGESLPITKNTEVLHSSHHLMDRRNMVYRGTIISSGKAIACVVSTGMETELGKIACSLQETTPPKTPLQKSVEAISMWTLPIVFGSIVIFAAIALYRGMNWVDVVLLGIAAAVSAIPEGLPAAFTITLAAGTSVMAKKNAIIRKLVAVETLGSTTVICSDKTGTLTMNQMAVTCVYDLEKTVQVTENAFTCENIPVNPKQRYALSKLLEIGALCNDSLVTKENNKFSMIGDPTEGALLVAALKGGFNHEELKSTYPRTDEIPFLSENLFMATLHSTKEGKRAYLKGAPEKILSFCHFYAKETGHSPLKEKEDEIKQVIEEMTKNALRLIAVAYCDLPSGQEFLSEEAFIEKSVFVGLFGMLDPPRQEAIEAIADCHAAGVKVKMVTGDNKKTAVAIAKQLGLSVQGALSGDEIELMDDFELKEKIGSVDVFARVAPLHKLRIVHAFKDRGEIVAMTGDGVNDAPALESADIGIAMGLSGTDVAKDSADMILADDNFASVVSAIEEGRAIFNRLRNVCAFLLSMCIGELLGLILCVLLIGLPPLLPLQILWINLAAGIIISVPLGYEPKTGKELKQPPRDPRVKLLFPGMIYRIVFFAFLLGLSILLLFHFSLKHFDLTTARTIILSSVVIFEWFIALLVRSDETLLLHWGLFRNRLLSAMILLGLILQFLIIYIPFFQIPFKTVPLTTSQWLLAIFPGTLFFLIENLRKLFFPTLFSKGKWKHRKSVVN